MGIKKFVTCKYYRPSLEKDQEAQKERKVRNKDAENTNLVTE